MPKPNTSSAKKAELKKRGHTASSNFGQDPSFKGRNSTAKRDLSID
jgi:hypothetical protein